MNNTRYVLSYQGYADTVVIHANKARFDHRNTMLLQSIYFEKCLIELTVVLGEESELTLTI